MASLLPYLGVSCGYVHRPAQLSDTEPGLGDRLRARWASTRGRQAPFRGKGQDLRGPAVPPATEAPVSLWSGAPVCVKHEAAT